MRMKKRAKRRPGWVVVVIDACAIIRASMDVSSISSSYSAAVFDAIAMRNTGKRPVALDAFVLFAVVCESFGNLECGRVNVE